jgi:hypothetical protein
VARTFVDSRGVLWEVEEALSANGDARCLRFTAPGEVRETGRVPEDWAALSETELEGLCVRGVRQT